MALKLNVETIPLPVSSEEAGTRGSSIVPHPALPLVVLSLPRATGSLPWVVVNVETGEVRKAKGLRGELRDGLVTGNTALCLTTHALCRIRWQPQPEVVEVYRPKGLGTYLWRLLDFGDELVAATGWATRSVLLLNRADGSVVKRLHIVSPHTSVRLPDGRIRLLSFHGSEAVDVDLQTLQPVARRALPCGTRPVVAGSETFVLTGHRKPANHEIPIEQMWSVEPQELAALDNDGYSVKRKVPAVRGARDVLGVADGTVVIATDSGIWLARADDLASVGYCEVSSLIGGCPLAFVPSARAVVLIDNFLLPTELKVITWSGARP
jgi:hypothetical protein